MELSILEKITLIALDDDTGKWVTDSMRLNYALAGGVLLQLTQKKKIELVNNKVKIIDNSPTDNFLINDSIKLIESIKNKKAVNVVYKLARLTRKLKDGIVIDLMAKGILKEQEGKVMWLFPTTHYPMVDSTLENRVKAELIDIVDNNHPVQNEDNLFLLSVLLNCNLEKEVFGLKANKKKIAKRIEELNSDNSIGGATNQALIQMQAAMTMLMISTSTITASSASR
ncbi:MAG: GPP34 family phosphoprotein [Candidatus Kapaibacterium sp.]|nr:GPP34 family phosphoprotein [Ignavibacteriota bacterium]MCB9221956.1 GPP34 family phosphoprotein [Ignavibacteria bacterium]